MRFFTTIAAVLATASVALAADSLCDKYTKAVLTDNTAANQLTLLTVIVNTVVIGNYSSVGQPGFVVPGILAEGTYQGTDVKLAPFFTGAGNTTNVGTAASGQYQVAGTNSMAGAVNFLDGGGATPLMNNMPANSATSNQYGLLTHLYEYFGVLLNCSQQYQMNPSPDSGNATYPFGAATDNGFNSYQGDPSMYDVHQFMDLTAAQSGYFIQQVALAANSLGVATADIVAVGTALATTFTEICSPPAQVVPNVPASYQYNAICIDSSCSKSPTDNCSSYANGATSLESIYQSASNTADPTSQTTPTTSLNVTYIAGLLTAQAAAATTTTAPTATPAPNSAAVQTGTAVALAATAAVALLL